MAREGSFLFIRFLLKTTLESRVSVLRWGKQLGDCFFSSTPCSKYFICILPAGDGLDSSLPSAGVKEEPF